MKCYRVEYELEGVRKSKSIEAPTPGSAFAKTLALFPGAKLVKCMWRTHLAGHQHMPMVHIEYDPPSTRQIEPLPAEPMREQVAFGFLEKIKPKRR